MFHIRPTPRSQNMGGGLAPRRFSYGIQPARRFGRAATLCGAVAGRTTGATACVTFCGWVKEGPLRRLGGEIRTNMK